MLGWIGERALLIQAESEIPTDTRLRGELGRLTAEPRKWVRSTPGLAAVCYDAVLDVRKPFQRPLLSIGGMVISIGMLAFWLHRLYRWRRPAVPAAPKPHFGPRLEAERPRSDEVVAMVLWRHGVALFVASFVLYALVVMLIPALIAADFLGFELWDNASTARHLALFALSFAITAPVSGLPCFWWIRRRRAEIRRVARNGEIIDGLITSATAWGTRGAFGLSSRFDASHTNIEVATALGGVTRYYRIRANGRPEWALSGTVVRVLTASEERFAIIIAPSGEDFGTRARRSWGRGADRKVDKLPSARILKAPSRNESAADAPPAARSDRGDGASSR